MQNKAELIFMKWKAELDSMDRTWPNVEGNFDLLWEQFHRAKIKMDTALEYLNKAAKAHHPNDSTVKRNYQKLAPYLKKDQSVSEYGEQWRDKITNKCKEVFFGYYEIDGLEKPPEKIGGMSRAEYNRLQKYADSHETIDWEALIEERDNTPVEDEDDGPDIDVSKVDINVDLGGL